MSLALKSSQHPVIELSKDSRCNLAGIVGLRTDLGVLDKNALVAIIVGLRAVSKFWDYLM